MIDNQEAQQKLIVIKRATVSDRVAVKPIDQNDKLQEQRRSIAIETNAASTLTKTLKQNAERQSFIFGSLSSLQLHENAERS